MRLIHKIAVVGTVMATMAAIGTGGALADPAVLPALTNIVGVNCPSLFTSAPVANTAGALAFDFDNQAPPPTNPVSCWDPTPGGMIHTKGADAADASCALPRPDGAAPAIAALNANQKDANLVGGKPVYCIDFAYSNRTPNTTTYNDTFVALARDAITWSYPKVTGQLNPQPATLTKAQLVLIYTCADTNWDQVGGAENAKIVPVLPQSGSGTRSEFLADIGVVNPGACVVNGATSGGATIEENTGLTAGNVAQFTPATSVNDIFPYSIGDYIAQGTAVKGTGAGTGATTVGGHASSTWAHGNLVLGQITDALGMPQAPITTNSSSQPVINPSFSTQFYNSLYDVVWNGWSAANGVPPTAISDAAFPTTPPYEAAGLPTIFSSTGWICTNLTAKSDIVSYGFLNLGANCGALFAGD